MALYPYRCKKCDSEELVVQTIKSYSESPSVPICCETMMQRVITAPMLAVDIAPYRSMIDGSIVNSRSEEREHMRKHGVVHTDEIMPDVERNRKRMLESFKEGVKDDIADAILRVEQGQKPNIIPEEELIPSA